MFPATTGVSLCVRSATSPHCLQIAVLSTHSVARSRSNSLMRNGRPQLSGSNEVSTTSTPRSFNTATTSSKSGSKKCASSMATTRILDSTSFKIFRPEDTGIAASDLPPWLMIASRPKRVSIACLIANTLSEGYRSTRFISSVVFPLNMQPKLSEVVPWSASTRSGKSRSASLIGVERTCEL